MSAKRSPGCTDRSSLAAAQAGSTAFRGWGFGDAADMSDLACTTHQDGAGNPKQFDADGIFLELMGKPTKAHTVGAR
jgi:hypothetical protein